MLGARFFRVNRARGSSNDAQGKNVCVGTGAFEDLIFRNLQKTNLQIVFKIQFSPKRNSSGPVMEPCETVGNYLLEFLISYIFFLEFELDISIFFKPLQVSLISYKNK